MKRSVAEGHRSPQKPEALELGLSVRGPERGWGKGGEAWRRGGEGGWGGRGMSHGHGEGSNKWAGEWLAWLL